VKLAGAVGAFWNWNEGWLGLGRGALFATIAGGVACLFWWSTTGLRKKFARPPQYESVEAEVPSDQPAPIGFGVHVPFGPMLAIGALLYFLVADRWIAAYFAELNSLL